MYEELVIDDVKFWVDNNIIYCKVHSPFDDALCHKRIDEIFSFAISTLSNGQYFPILINLREMNYKDSYRVFKVLSTNDQIKNLVLSKTFLVNTNRLKIFLAMYNLTIQPVVLNTIFKDNNLAIRECEKNYTMFYPLRLE